MTSATEQGWTAWDSAADRAALARTRAYELQQRRAELAGGMPVSAASAGRARLRAFESLQRAKRAYRAAADRHLEASAAHQRAAAAHDRIAVLTTGADSVAHRDAADKHRSLAARHDAAAVADAAHG